MILPSGLLYPSPTLYPAGLTATHVTATVADVPVVYVLVSDSVP